MCHSGNEGIILETKFVKLSLHSVLDSEGHPPNKSFAIGLKPLILDLYLVYSPHNES